ncbi:MAG TPA: hypothetical protein ENN76_03015 [Euryarchaeota archaeon]|nr:hypothetical protein [Euryarchaeota archaeon]
MPWKRVLHFSVPLDGNVLTKDGVMAIWSGNALYILENTGRVAMSSKVDQDILSVSLKGGGSFEGHILTDGGVSRFTRMGLLSKVKIEEGALQILDEQRGQLLFGHSDFVSLYDPVKKSTLWTFEGEYFHGRCGAEYLLAGKKLVVLSKTGELLLEMPGNWTPLFGDLPSYLGDGIITYKDGAFVGRPALEKISCGGEFDKKTILANGKTVVLDDRGSVIWEGSLSGTLVGSLEESFLVSKDGSIYAYALIKDEQELFFEILCKGKSRCGTFVSSAYTRRCPCCKGEDIVVSRQVVDSRILGSE